MYSKTSDWIHSKNERLEWIVPKMGASSTLEVSSHRRNKETIPKATMIDTSDWKGLASRIPYAKRHGTAWRERQDGYAEMSFLRWPGISDGGLDASNDSTGCNLLKKPRKAWSPENSQVAKWSYEEKGLLSWDIDMNGPEQLRNRQWTSWQVAEDLT
jgi:hypothetical protein